MSFLASALELAAKGFHVFPLNPKSKVPLIEDFPNMASRDPEQIKKWWVDPVLKMEQPYNIGISTTKFGENEALIVVDVDNKGVKNGDEEIVNLEIGGKIFPPTYTQFTPTGGRHLLYKSREARKQGSNVLGAGLDIRSRGGYVVGCGSQIEESYYTANNCSLSEVPQWIFDKCGEIKEKEEKKINENQTEIINEDFAKDRVVHYLVNEAPLAVEGSGGDQTTYKVAAKVKDFGVSEEVAFDLMWEHWNPRCQPPWNYNSIADKIKNAFRYGNLAAGTLAPETQFEPIHEPTEEEKNYLQNMNKEFALIYIEGSHFILHETLDEKGKKKRNYLSEMTFKRKFSPYTVQQGKGRPLSRAEIWLDWKGRREYKGLCFAPERDPKNGYFNTWTGFTVESTEYKKASPDARRGFDMFIEHARHNVCRNDTDLFNWLIGYFAHMIQKPYERPLTTLVFRGRKGTGKNALVDRIGKLLGSNHYLVAHDGRYLTSNFNGHLDACLCLVLDEAFWSGDKAAEGKLKGLTTAPEILIERKGKEPYAVDNLVRLVVIGNEDWLVPASNDERRYAVFDIGEGRKQDQEFFETVRILMDDKGGNQILLNYLKTFDLSKTNVNKAPNTSALLDQKTASLDPFYQWWLDCLSDGRIIGADFQQSWPEQIDKETFRNGFRRYMKERQIRSRIPEDRAVGKLLKNCLPKIVTDKKRREGEHLVNVYYIPSLNEARKSWETFIGHPVTWE